MICTHGIIEAMGTDKKISGMCRKGRPGPDFLTQGKLLTPGVALRSSEGS